MPAQVEVMRDCASNYGVYQIKASSGNLYYTVSFSGSEGGAHCTCPAYRYSKELPPHCKHIDRVWNGACMYNPQWCDGHKPVEFKPITFNYDAFADEPCPSCGGPTVYVRRAV